MTSVSTMSEFFGWCTVLNSLILIILTIVLASSLGSHAKKIQGRLFNLSDAKISELYFSFLSNYKLAILFFNLIPYIALKMIV